MGVNLLYYRPWRGSFRSPEWTVWPIARVALGMLFRRRLFGLGLFRVCGKYRIAAQFRHR